MGRSRKSSDAYYRPSFGVFSFLRSHIIVICILVFSISTSIFLAYHLKFFSTLLIYLPVVAICSPLLAIFDGVNWRNRLHWSRSRWTRFALNIFWCTFIILSSRYPTSGPSSYLNPTASLPSLPGNNTTYFIAANLYNSGSLLPIWTRELTLLIDHLGRQNVFVSIYESNSQDNTKNLLRVFAADLETSGVRNNVVLEDTDGGRRTNWQLNGHQRIRYMADARNRALEPISTEVMYGRSFDKLIFFNDVYFDWSSSFLKIFLLYYQLIFCYFVESIVRLLATKEGQFDLACALDFDGIGLYDMLVPFLSLTRFMPLLQALCYLTRR